MEEIKEVLFPVTVSFQWNMATFMLSAIHFLFSHGKPPWKHEKCTSLKEKL